MTVRAEEEARVERQVRFFGADGQERIASARAAVVGCGGLGSHIVQQLGYVGVGDIVLIDPDTVDPTSGNRLIGLEPYHVEERAPKVTVMEDLLARIRPGILTSAHQTLVSDKPAIRALADRSVVFCCVDRVTARSDANVICAATNTPLVDSATEVIVNAGVWGGRTTLCLERDSCLSCMGEISQDDLRRELQDADGLKGEEKIYGVPRAMLADSGPSTVFLNGVVASHAVHEWAVHVSGVRLAKRNLIFDGLNGVVRVDRTPPHTSCYVCGRLRGVGDISPAALFGR